MAWTGKLLRVNLTAGTCTSEPLRMVFLYIRGEMPLAHERVGQALG